MVDPCFDLRCRVRLEVEGLERARPLAVRALKVDFGVGGDKGDREVRGVRRYTGFAAAEDCVAAIFSVAGGAAASRHALVALEVALTEVRASGALQQVSTDRGHVPELRRRRQLKALGNEPVAVTNGRLGSQLAHPH